MLKHNTKWRIIAAGIIGNVIEYYDFALIGFLAVAFAQLFFPSSDPFLSLLGSFGAFAAGMIMRPVGAIFFGHIGDKISRKYALFGSLLLMSLPTFLIGFLPTYAQIGVIAPLLLVLLRMIQGFSVGGEYASSIVYLVEEAPQGQQNLYGSFISLGAKLGMAIGSGFCGFLLIFYGEKEILEWVWRVPFLASMVLALIGLLLRKGLEDNYKSTKSDKIPIVEILKSYKTEFWTFVVIASAIWMFYYTLFVYLPVWLHEYAGLTKKEASALNTYSITLGVFSILAAAYTADKIGSLKVIKISSFFTIVLILPIFLALRDGELAIKITAISLMTLLLCSMQAPIFALVVNTIGERGYKASFTAVVLGSAAGIVGGSTPALMTAAINLTSSSVTPAFILIALLALSLYKMFKKK